LAKLGRSIERNAKALGVAPRQRLDDCFSPLLQLSQMVPAIDFPRQELPANFHYTGPFRRSRDEAFQLPPGDDRPLIYCSLGTLQGSRAGLFRRVAAACAKLDLRLLLTQGGSGSARLGSLAGDPLVYDWVPQEAVLAHASLTICHGGMNTVLDSLAAGVPIVITPLAFEQAAIAERLRYARVADVLAPRSSPRRIAEAMAVMLKAPVFRARARAIQREISDAGGAAGAADLIEAALPPAAARARPAGATMADAAPGDARGDIRSGGS
jgi:zeaxanthin glucosyltransferase